MKITLAVLFLAGLTIYCKCAAVLSLPPSLIAHAASLERTQAPKSSPTDNGQTGDHGGGAEDSAATELAANDHNDDDAGIAGVGVSADSTASYKNFKNLWQKNFGLQKRDRNAFEDDIAAVVAAASDPQMLLQQAQSQQQPIATIMNNKNALKVAAAMPKQLLPQEQQSLDNENNKFLKSKSSATIGRTPDHYRQQHTSDDDDEDQAKEYDSNEWSAYSPQMMDDISVSPPHGATIIEGDRNYDADDGDDNNLEPLAAATPQQLQYDFTAPENDDFLVDADEFSDDSPDPVLWNKFLRPLNYWAKRCQVENENQCLQEYYLGLIADRNNAVSQHLRNVNDVYPSALNIDPLTQTSPLDSIHNSPDSASREALKTISNDDVVLLLTAEQNLIQFLLWALAEQYPYGKFANVSEDDAVSYHPGTYVWKKFNLSGRLEPPLMVEEPHYVIVRREYDPDDDFKKGRYYRDDPFIPPRGRKHNLPDLDALLQRYETFVPNRGRRDKIKDIFKYDDLFYPNRGKRQMTLQTMRNNKEENKATAAAAAVAANSLMQLQLKQPPLTTTLEQINNVMAKMKRKLHQMIQQLREQENYVANTFDEMMPNRNKPTTRMSTTYQPPQHQQQQWQLSKRFKSMANNLQQQRRQHQVNGNNRNSYARRQWWKRYSQLDNNDRPAAAAMRSRTMATNRLHALRSMSPQQRQQSRLVNVPENVAPSRLYQTTKFMWQPQQEAAQPPPPLQPTAQFDPLSWHKLQTLQHQYHLPLLTMRHPRLTVQQHLPPAMLQPHGQQLATPQETQLPLYSSIDPNASADNTMANDLKDLFNRNHD